MLVEEFKITPIHGTNEYNCESISPDPEDWYETADYMNGLEQLGEVSEADDLDRGLVHNLPEDVIIKKVTDEVMTCCSYYVGYVER